MWQVASALVAKVQRMFESAWRMNKRIRVSWGGRESEGIARAHRAARSSKMAARREQIDMTLDKRANRGRERKKKYERKVKMMWQNEWYESEKGRMIYEWCREMGMERTRLTHKGMQLVSGHGNVKGYLKRFGLKQGDGDGSCKKKM